MLGRVSDPIVDNLLDTLDDQEVGRRLPRALAPFRTPAYRLLAVSLAFGAFSQGVWLVALVWEVFRLGGDAGDLSLVSSASALGVVIPALVAGVVADRVPQKYVLVAVAGVETTTATLAAVLATLDLTSTWALAAISFVAGVAMTFYYPAYSALLPALIPEQDLMAVNGFEGMVRPTIGQAIGPAVAGAVVGVAAPSVAFFVAAGAMAVALVALTLVPRTPVRRDLAPPDGHPVRTALADVAEGFAYMARTPWLLSSLLCACVMVLVIMGPLEVLVPVFIKDVLDGTASQHSWVLAAFGIGGAVGSFVMASRPMPRRYLSWLLGAWGVCALPFIAVAHAHHVWVVVVAAAVMGATFALPMVIWGTLLQRRVPPELLGRVSSLDFFVSTALMPVSMALVGPFSDLVGTRATFWVAALVPVLAAAAAWSWGRLGADEVAHPLT